MSCIVRFGHKPTGVGVMIRAEKLSARNVESFNELEELLKRSKIVLLTDFTGMSVATSDKLRRECFKKNIKYHVTKNTVARFALESRGYSGLEKFLTGQTGFCFGFDDPILPVRMLSDFIRENKRPVIKGALLDGHIYGPAQVDQLKNLPPREVLLAIVIGSICAPLSGFVYVLNEIVRSFVSVVDAIACQAEADPTGRDGLSTSGGSVQAIIEAIEKMTVLELVELKKALEEKFGVSAAAPMMAGGGMMGAAAPAPVEEVEVVKTEFDVILTSGGDKKVQVIKVVKDITGLGLKEAKALVDESPKAVKTGISNDEAMAIKLKIEEVGGQVEIK